MRETNQNLWLAKMRVSSINLEYFMSLVRNCSDENSHYLASSPMPLTQHDGLVIIQCVQTIKE